MPSEPQLHRCDDWRYADGTWQWPSSNLGCIFLFQECLFLGLCFSFLPGFLQIPWDSCFFRRIFFTGTSFWLGRIPPNYSGITGIFQNSCSRQTKLPWFDSETMAWRGVGEVSAHIMGYGERTPSTQHIAVTLTPWATRQCAGWTRPSATAWEISLFWGWLFVCIVLIEKSIKTKI